MRYHCKVIVLFTAPFLQQPLFNLFLGRNSANGFDLSVDHQSRGSHDPIPGHFFNILYIIEIRRQVKFGQRGQNLLAKLAAVHTAQTQDPNL